MPFDENSWRLPKAEGLYDPAFEKAACGVGFVVNIDGRRNHKVKGANASDTVYGGLCQSSPDILSILNWCKDLLLKIPLYHIPGSDSTSHLFHKIKFRYQISTDVSG
jgi:hypothetical protein